jgi:kynureninase
MTLSDAQALDRADPLAPLRDRFSIPDGTIYLDGNSLGALPRSVAARTAKVVSEEWAAISSPAGTATTGSTCRAAWASGSRR